ncbi:hypothetical protein GCM10011511_54420 [Puia dinghuensis]|uniref:Uncharacterized protein n=1 Tax=Puia dinghuensis TaxID=1792502 RepID=A0A8J2UIR8_9BACT|nr:hypothetical protein GCM10011511_54420 [Puia dinghuensis]
MLEWEAALVVEGERGGCTDDGRSSGGWKAGAGLAGPPGLTGVEAMAKLQTKSITASESAGRQMDKRFMACAAFMNKKRQKLKV